MRKALRKTRMLRLLAAFAVVCAPAISLGQITVTATLDGSPDLTVPNTNFSVTVSASGFTSEAPTAYDFRVNYSASDIELLSTTDLTPYFPDGDVVVNPAHADNLIPDAAFNVDGFVTSWNRHVSGADLGGTNLPGMVNSSYNLVRLNFRTTASPAGPIFLQVVKNDRSPRPINAALYTGAGANPTPIDNPTFNNAGVTGLMGALDRDGDGVRNGLESIVLLTPAGQTSAFLLDTDGDGLNDEQERNYDTTFAVFKDFVFTNGQDTNPRLRDTDSDGWLDGLEVRFPLVFVNGPLVIDNGLVDADGDGLPSVLDPNDADSDHDNDRYADGYEAAKLGLAAVSNVNVKPSLGDLNNSGTVNNTDSTILANIVAANLNPLTAAQLSNFDSMDLNRSGTVNNTDTTILKNFVAGNTALLPFPIN